MSLIRVGQKDARLATLAQIMTPGEPCPRLRSVASSVIGATATMFTVPTGRKYVVKSIALGGADAANGGLTNTITITRTGATRNWVTTYPVPPNTQPVIGLAQVFNAGEAMAVTCAGTGGLDVTVTYADLPASEGVVRFCEAASATVVAGFVTLYTAPTNTPVVITSILFGNTQATTQRVSILTTAGHAPIWRAYLQASDLETLDAPICLSPAETLQVAMYDTDNAIAVTASGYYAQRSP